MSNRIVFEKEEPANEEIVVWEKRKEDNDDVDFLPLEEKEATENGIFSKKDDNQ